MNILITSVGRRSYLVKYFKDAIGNEGLIHVMNSTAVSPAFPYADRAVLSPLIYDSRYIPFLLEYCSANRIDALLSCFDIDLCMLAAHKEDFDRIGTRVIVADYDIVSVCEDKWKTAGFLKKYGFDVPRTYLDPESAKKDLKAGLIGYPLIVKPRRGMGSISIYEADNDSELDVFFAKTRKNIMNTYLKYESLQDPDRSTIIQEKITGQEFGVDIINDLNGNYVNTVVKKKFAMRAGETDCAVTVDDDGIREIGKKLAGITRHPGNLDVDMFACGNRYLILEMNARFGGGYPFSHLAGVNEPKAIIEWLKGKETDTALLTPRYGVIGQKDISMTELTDIQEESL